MTTVSFFKKGVESLCDVEAADDRTEVVAVSAVKEVRHAKLQCIRVSREENLRKIFPATLEDMVSYDFITAGDIDALSFVAACLDRYGWFDRFYASTWTLSRPDVELLDHWLETKALREINFFTGEYFASRETAVYATLLDVLKRHRGRLRTFRNHCKVVLLGCPQRNVWISIRGSANFSTNPRTEQTVLTVSKELFDFYADWFEKLFEKPSTGKYDNRIEFRSGGLPVSGADPRPDQVAGSEKRRRFG